MAKTFTSVSEFKKILAVNDKLHTIFHLQISGYDENQKAMYVDKDMGVRECSIKQSNSFALKTLQTDGITFKDSWCNYPKASEAKIENGKLIIYQKDMRNFSGSLRNDESNPEYNNLPLIPVLTYEFVD